MYPDWFEEALRASLPGEGSSIAIMDRDFIMRDGLLRDAQIDDEMQRQTSESFNYKWSRTETYGSESVLNATRAWLIERYGDLSRRDYWEQSGDALEAVRYVGADISAAVDVAAGRSSGDHDACKEGLMRKILPFRFIWMKQSG